MTFIFFTLKQASHLIPRHEVAKTLTKGLATVMTSPAATLKITKHLWLHKPNISFQAFPVFLTRYKFLTSDPEFNEELLLE